MASSSSLWSWVGSCSWGLGFVVVVVVLGRVVWVGVVGGFVFRLGGVGPVRRRFSVQVLVVFLSSLIK